ncbi:hypothetical protein CYMTET_12633 [Cymbomonas tetramitiformis]|uniref:Uncharacterized protein n=1 Tax=Cymbomonas tetramitiformis TaxID=36881 RepID=A0AAE0GKA0_9CHLO|nr:hypothetical protein CYMTET_12633 [Cymbomonas tetramitiformis]
MGSGAVRTFEEFDSDEEEDESEYPVGYFDDSEDSLEEEDRDRGHLAPPLFSDSRLEQGSSLDIGLQLESYGGVLQPSIEEDFLPQREFSVGTASFREPDTEEFENDTFPEAAFAEEGCWNWHCDMFVLSRSPRCHCVVSSKGEEHNGDYTPEEWAAWDAWAYESHEYGGVSGEFAEHFDEYGDDEYYSDDY